MLQTEASAASSALSFPAAAQLMFAHSDSLTHEVDFIKSASGDRLASGAKPTTQESGDDDISNVTGGTKGH